MTENTNLKNALKTFIVPGALTMALAFVPTISMADNDGRHHKNYSSDSDKQHSKGRYSGSNHNVMSHGKGHISDYRHSRKNQHGHSHYRPYKHVNFNHGHHKHRVKKHNHREHSQNHTHYVVNEYYYDDHYDLDHLRFMIGLHTNNLDIILRE